MSAEVDILPIADDNDETARLADLIEGVAGEFSPFEELHGFSIDGVDLSTSALPTGWRGRLVKVQNANTAAPDGEPRYTGWCLGQRQASRWAAWLVAHGVRAEEFARWMNCRLPAPGSSR
jgi:hypothetical protein